MFEDEEQKEKYTFKAFCVNCGHGMTWADQKYQFGRF